VDLNPEQREAIEHGDGPLMVLAGAGTGKTRVLVHRIARLVELGTEPWAILAVTFTNKAAGEMRHRLRQLLGDAADAMWIGTFHATCARLLRRFGECVGLARGFAIYDDDDQVKIVERILKEIGIEEQVSPRVILSRIDRAKNRGSDPPPPTGSFDDAVERVYPLYQAQLARENAVDFNDLILKTIDLLDREPAAGVLRVKFRHVLVDEFQDTNQMQYQLVRRLSRATRNLTVVGDDDQSIYAWRGAEPRNLLDFGLDFPDARSIKLEQNYRSTQTILDAANEIIRRNSDRHEKALWTQRDGGHPIEIHQADDERGEAIFVARSIHRLLESKNCQPGDVAILYRTNQQSRVLEEHLRAWRVPARVVGSTSFFDRKEIRDAVAYLRILVNHGADSSMERVINVPARGIGSTTVDRIRDHARAGGSSFCDSVRRAGAGEISGIGSGPRRKVKAFVDLIDQLRFLAAGGASVSQVVVQVIERSGIRAKLESDPSTESRDRLDSLAELVAMASDMEGDAAPASPSTSSAQSTAPAGDPADRRDEPPGVVDFLERVALSSTDDDQAKARVKATAVDRVGLMTIHVAKGLEWPVVFVAGMEDGLFPSLREREEVSEDAAMEEERRLAYVAITRARDRLVMSHALTRRVWGEVRIQGRSRFLDDLPGGSLAPPGSSRSGILIAAGDLAAGDLVSHVSLGSGSVVQVVGSGEDRRVSVDFADFGRQVVLARFLSIRA
jgi:DNA helicase-2/ATP-dependent DNA helicase PcrA